VFITICLGSLLGGCGAPVKSAGDVSGLFQVESETLGEKEQTLCQELASRSQEPTTQNLNIDLGGCKDSGEAALNYKQVSSFYFLGLTGDDTGATTTTEVIHKSVRAELWLNKSLISLASALVGKLQDKQGAGDLTGKISLPDSDGGSIANLVQPNIEIVEQPKFDIDKKSFSMKIHLTLSGVVKADHIITVDGQLLGESIAVVLQTTADQPYEKSILKNFKAVALIIPHAGDVYLDLFVDLNVYNFGLTTLVNDQLTSFLSTGLKSVADSVMTL